VLSLSACTLDGKAGPGQVVDCTDSRDGERFTMRSENLQTVRIGIGGAGYIDGFDDDGRYRRLSEVEAPFIKCIPRGGNQ
jgi:hypothetical protein